MSRALDRFDWTLQQLDPRPGERILEIGCGSGEALRRLALLAPKVRPVGMDRSGTGIARARARLADAGLGDRVELIEGELPGAGGPTELDRTFAINVNAFWVRPEPIFADVVARLRPGGVLLLAYEAPHPDRAADVAERLSAAARRPGLRVAGVATGPDPRWVCLRAERID